MKNLSTYIESIPPGKLSELREMRPNDSTRDKKRLLDFIKKLESDLGGFVIMSKTDYIKAMLNRIHIQFRVYELFAIDYQANLSFQNRKTGESFHIQSQDLLDKILDYLTRHWIDIDEDDLIFNDIIELIENKEFRV